MNAKVNPDKTGKGKRQMYRVMIVDDEPLILAGIASLLDWKEYGCEISGKAANGQQALKLMEDAWNGRNRVYEGCKGTGMG